MINAGIDHVVGKQLELGIDCIGDGEFWKIRTFAYLKAATSTGIETEAAQAGRARLHPGVHPRAR